MGINEDDRLSETIVVIEMTGLQRKEQALYY
jgi:hypothetical protein